MFTECVMISLGQWTVPRGTSQATAEANAYTKAVFPLVYLFVASQCCNPDLLQPALPPIPHMPLLALGSPSYCQMTANILLAAQELVKQTWETVSAFCKCLLKIERNKYNNA